MRLITIKQLFMSKRFYNWKIKTKFSVRKSKWKQSRTSNCATNGNQWSLNSTKSSPRVAASNQILSKIWFSKKGLNRRALSRNLRPQKLKCLALFEPVLSKCRSQISIWGTKFAFYHLLQWSLRKTQIKPWPKIN